MSAHQQRGLTFCLVLIPANPRIAPPWSPSHSDIVPGPVPPGPSQSSRHSFPTNINFSIHFFVLVPCLVPPPIPGNFFRPSMGISFVTCQNITPFAPIRSLSRIVYHPPCPFVSHDQHTIPTLRFVFTSLPRLFLFHRHASLSFEMSPSAFSGKHPPQNTNRDACQSIPCR